MKVSYKNIIFGLLFFFFWYFFSFFRDPSYDMYAFFPKIQSWDFSTYSWSILDSKKVREIYSIISENYFSFNTKNKKELEDTFIEGMATSLGDKYTNYFNDIETKKFTDTLHGDFEGIGAVIQENIKWIQIMKVLENSPAEKIGLVAWDIIISVNGRTVVWLTSEEAVNMIRWPKWTTITILYIEAKTKSEKTIKIQRDTVVVPTVVSEIKDKNIGYIEVNIFGENTALDFQKQFTSLIGSGAKGIIIDLRNNWGGFLESSVDILSTILPKNKVTVVTKGTNPRENMTFYTQKGTQNNVIIPIIILINSMSASASEITAGALQDYERALIVWEKSYGKGSVQTPFPLSDGSMIKITTAKWFTPNGRLIDEKWIEPDIKINLTADDYKNTYDRQLDGAKKILKIQIEKKKTTKEMKELIKTMTF